MAEISPLFVFVASCVGYIQLTGKYKAIEQTTINNVPSDTEESSMSIEEALKIREKHFCKRVTISYCNSGPLMILGGTGSRLIDSNHTSYLDTRNNVAHCGHNHPGVVSAVQKQIAALNSNTRYLHPNACLLSQKLADLFPAQLEVVFFVNSGSEANDLALRLARAKTGSKNTIVLDRAYHGHTLSTLEMSPYKYENSAEFPNRRPPDYVVKVPCPDTYRGKHRGHDAAERYADYVKKACSDFGGKGRVSAILIESGMSVAGVILPPPTYLHRIAKHVRDCGGVFIADEIQTGFGRFGSCYWGFQHRDQNSFDEVVVPDIVTVGKPFGNGMPLAAVITTREIAEAFEEKGVEYFNTFGGNPVCAAAGIAVLDIVQSESLQERAYQVGSYFRKRFAVLKETMRIIGDVRGSGLFIGIELVRDRSTQEPATAETSFLCTILKSKYSILTSIDGPYSNVIVIKPPMVFTETDVDEFVKSFQLAVTVDLNGVNFDVASMSHTPT
mmetsp:Transcript_33296/g.48954  ORF Transcript_33296/g.48954 Transcript_33296/m.48954 type:complete len:500 (+) Transcript_33296:93-1592(+)|eukprot:CAMPEP_0195528846 /NCGR_PEP_ID=MMETSP0794_2-20130614/31179_1 /TAXON_ID=515487 /ORGANISM="Stephanopyxis turris, Strain CCMP 815" /LENGTH=499 /DNA_ID=CAMNT_0040660053 /DNA_START=72 /DNA_END=1571 /DNA_ORIENTATION=+